MAAKVSGWLAVVVGALLVVAAAAPAQAAEENKMNAGHVTGIGGVFLKSKDPKALIAWYRDVMGLQIEDWGGALLKYDALGHPPVAVWAPFSANTEHFAPSTREFMLNFAVDDMDAFLAKLKAKGVTVLKQDDTSDPNGRFAWIMDPDGSKIELWQPR
jgi:catechol 2,3-dioxygenase-like lactoylglutathione lyase family enzyme